MFTKGLNKTAGRLGERIKTLGTAVGADVQRLRKNTARVLTNIRKTQGPEEGRAMRRLLLHDFKKVQENVMGSKRSKGVVQ